MLCTICHLTLTLTPILCVHIYKSRSMISKYIYICIICPMLWLKTKIRVSLWLANHHKRQKLKLTTICIGFGPELMTLSLRTAGSSIVRNNPKSSISNKENMPGAVQKDTCIQIIHIIQQCTWLPFQSTNATEAKSVHSMVKSHSQGHEAFNSVTYLHQISMTVGKKTPSEIMPQVLSHTYPFYCADCYAFQQDNALVTAMNCP